MDQHLLGFVNAIDASFKKLVQESVTTEGIAKLSVNQIHYIEAISKLYNPTVTDIANAMNLSKASVTAGINKLVESGYAKKMQSTEDKRVFYVSLTDKSASFIQAKTFAAQSFGKKIEETLTPEEAEQFKTILIKLTRAFKEK
ncbi:MarR family transcriptional regulator [Paenalkalicoccus suaedae]|uniref:MarR family transcriptional regulator n=1 Tax=Paenalkalicoccus suaedae TaxID=2592382 RepID=A0A859FHY8_9BACI|nr:MarR family transcriptional regulator [Paenalkalicoccus suaedae]QKS72711.1 MarR family transcriptional regulator [Paenalkalicoccus suaedae]